MKTNIYWFRQDLRLDDSPALLKACHAAQELLLVYIHPSRLDGQTSWGFSRLGAHRLAHIGATVHALSGQIAEKGNTLFEFRGSPAAILQQLVETFNIDTIYCDAIEAPEEQSEITEIRQRGLNVADIWQSTMFDPHALPFAPEQMPDTFTAFRQQVEKSRITPRSLTPPPTVLPSAPREASARIASSIPSFSATEARSTSTLARSAGEEAALASIKHYFSTKHPLHYKQTRNQLLGEHYSTRLSTWLATGSVSAATAYALLREFEAVHGSNDSTYWIFFELLWRDYFRFLHLKYGHRLYLRHGLKRREATPTIDTTTQSLRKENFAKWTMARTKNGFINAGMTELRETGYLSNRMRQVVASYLIYDLEGDWRAGAAWFENQLLDFDVYSNQGNWLYIAGLGTDPRGGRRMNIQKQIQDHDPEGIYRKHWGQA